MYIPLVPRKAQFIAIAVFICVFSIGLADATANIVTLANHSFEQGLSTDFVGTFGDQDGSFAGEITTNPRTGAQHFFADLGNNSGGIGFGGSLTGVTVDPSTFGPLEYGAEFSLSLYLAANGSDQPTGGEISFLFEFFDVGGNIIHVDGPPAPIAATSLGTNYSQFSQSYQLDAADLPDLSLVDTINATIFTFNSNNTADGQVFMDDFLLLYEVQAVPEPGLLIPLLGLVGLRLTRRRKQN